MKRFSLLLASVESELVFRENPSPLPVQEITGFNPPEALSKYTVFADEEFNIGEAWYCEDPASGAIYRVSPEYGDSAEFVNSNMQAFNASIEAAARWSVQYDKRAILMAPQLVNALADSLYKLDPKAFESPQYHWPMMIEHIRTCVADGDEEMELRFEIT